MTEEKRKVQAWWMVIWDPLIDDPRKPIPHRTRGGLGVVGRLFRKPPHTKRRK